MSNNIHFAQATELVNQFESARDAYDTWLERTFPVGSEIRYDGPFGGRVRSKVAKYEYDTDGMRVLVTTHFMELSVVRNNVELIPAEAK